MVTGRGRNGGGDGTKTLTPLYWDFYLNLDLFECWRNLNWMHDFNSVKMRKTWVWSVWFTKSSSGPSYLINYPLITHDQNLSKILLFFQQAKSYDSIWARSLFNCVEILARISVRFFQKKFQGSFISSHFPLQLIRILLLLMEDEIAAELWVWADQM